MGINQLCKIWRKPVVLFHFGQLQCFSLWLLLKGRRNNLVAFMLSTMFLRFSITLQLQHQILQIISYYFVHSSKVPAFMTFIKQAFLFSLFLNCQCFQFLFWLLYDLWSVFSKSPALCSCFLITSFCPEVKSFLRPLGIFIQNEKGISITVLLSYWFTSGWTILKLPDKISCCQICLIKTDTEIYMASLS